MFLLLSLDSALFLRAPEAPGFSDSPPVKKSGMLPTEIPLFVTTASAWSSTDTPGSNLPLAERGRMRVLRLQDTDKGEGGGGGTAALA